MHLFFRFFYLFFPPLYFSENIRVCQMCEGIQKGEMLNLNLTIESTLTCIRARRTTPETVLFLTSPIGICNTAPSTTHLHHPPPPAIFTTPSLFCTFISVEQITVIDSKSCPCISAVSFIHIVLCIFLISPFITSYLFFVVVVYSHSLLCSVTLKVDRPVCTHSYNQQTRPILQ